MNIYNAILRSTRGRAVLDRCFSGAAVPVSLISELRKTTGASIQKCKEALEQSNQDVMVAIDFLRRRGEAINQKLSSIQAAGCKVSASVSSDGRAAVVSKTTSMTDFAAASELFVVFSKHVADALLNSSIDNSCTIPSNLSLPGSSISPLLHGVTLDEVLCELSSVLTEPVKISHVERITGDILGVYVHGKSPYGSSVGSAVSAVALSVPQTKISTEQIRELNNLANCLARQVLGTSPRYIRTSDVPSSVIDNERSVLAHKVTNPTALDKAFAGHMRKFYSENCLMEMEWILPSLEEEGAIKAPTVHEYMHSECNRIGIDPSSVRVLQFTVVK